MRRFCVIFAIIFIIYLTVGCINNVKKPVELLSFCASEIVICPRSYEFIDNNEGVFFFSYDDYTSAQGSLHWEILNVKTGQRYVFLSKSGFSFLNIGTTRAEYCFAVPSGKYRLTKLYIDEFDGGISGDKESILFYEFDIKPLRATYLGHVVVNDIDKPVLGDIQTENWLKGVRSMLTGASILQRLVIEVTDLYETDIKWFQKHYKQVGNVHIDKGILRLAAGQERVPHLE